MTVASELPDERGLYRDVGLAVALGPLRVCVPLVGYIILYPLIVRTAGLRVLGLWSLLTTIVGYLTLTDVGFSQLLMREAGHNRSDGELTEAELDYKAARRAYRIVGLAVCCLAASLGPFIISLFARGIYGTASLAASVVTLIGASTIILTAKLDSAILAARQDNRYVQAVAALTPVITFAAAIGGTAAHHPIEGFAFGTLAAGVVQLALYRARLRNKHPAWGTGVTLAWRDTLPRLARLARRGFHLYSISVGFMARDPVFRFVVALLTGFAGVAIYDIALRVTQTVRDLVATGFYVLYPTLAVLQRSNDRPAAQRLMQSSLIVVLGAGALTLGVILAVPELIYQAWLGHSPHELVTATRLLVFWNLLTVANVPFWFMLQAFGHERVAARSLWIHTGSVLLLAGLQTFVHFNLTTVLVYWLVGAALTQVMIYYSVHRSLGMLMPVVATRRFALLVAVIAGFVFVVTVAPALRNGTSPLGASLGIFKALPVYGLFATLVVGILWLPLREFVARGR
jgi:O-antigen/teichoic acid export membrane protein